MKKLLTFVLVIVLMSSLAPVFAGSKANLPVFTLAVSEYPSWSAFLVASDEGIIDGRKGRVGPVEEKWGVDIVLIETDYDTCITLFSNGKADAACLTDMDSLAPSLGRKAVAILPTSTSDGADACIVTKDIMGVKDLKGVKVYGLELSVSQYCFDRNLELQGENPDDYLFTNQDPGAATIAMMGKQDTHKAIVVWNPFVMECLKGRSDVHVLFDSTTIKGEIVDMVTAARSSLERENGKEFACAVVDAYYEINKLIDGADTRDSTLIALGQRFSKLGLEDMRTVVRQTKFYNTPEKGLEVFSTVIPSVMDNIVKFCVRRGIVQEAPSISYSDDPNASLCFDSQYIRAVAGK